MVPITRGFQRGLGSRAPAPDRDVRDHRLPRRRDGLIKPLRKQSAQRLRRRLPELRTNARGYGPFIWHLLAYMDRLLLLFLNKHVSLTT